jgi:hypothetical protein
VLPLPLVVCFTAMSFIFNPEKSDTVSLAVVAGTSKGSVGLERADYACWELSQGLLVRESLFVLAVVSDTIPQKDKLMLVSD